MTEETNMKKSPGRSYPLIISLARSSLSRSVILRFCHTQGEPKSQFKTSPANFRNVHLQIPQIHKLRIVLAVFLSFRIYSKFLCSA
jgi:hypothetical protein